MAPHVVLHQFPFSHYNEKARWALDWKGIAHERKHYLPGLHAGALQALSGQTSTPVLTIDDEAIAGSAAIIDALEERFDGAPSLYPANAEERSEALALQKSLDAGLGIAVRACVFSVALHYPAYVADMFSQPQPAPKRLLYRLMMPIGRKKVARAYDTNNADYVARCFREVDDGLREIAARTSGSNYLVGDAFSVADLTGAALLGPLSDPDHPDMARPRPMPAPLAELIARYREEPAMVWARRCYQQHRSPAA